MKKTLTIVILTLSLSVSAFWGNNNSRNNQSWNNWNEYEVWEPRYWVEKMEDIFDNNRGGNNYPMSNQFNRFNRHNQVPDFINDRTNYNQVNHSHPMHHHSNDRPHNSIKK